MGVRVLEYIAKVYLLLMCDGARPDIVISSNYIFEISCSSLKAWGQVFNMAATPTNMKTAKVRIEILEFPCPGKREQEVHESCMTSESLYGSFLNSHVLFERRTSVA